MRKWPTSVTNGTHTLASVLWKKISILFQTHITPIPLLLFCYMMIVLYMNYCVITFYIGKDPISMLLLLVTIFWVFLTQQGSERIKGMAESYITRLAK